MKSDLITLFHKDLNNYSDSDIHILAKYFNLPFGSPVDRRWLIAIYLALNTKTGNMTPDELVSLFSEQSLNNEIPNVSIGNNDFNVLRTENGDIAIRASAYTDSRACFQLRLVIDAIGIDNFIIDNSIEDEEDDCVLSVNLKKDGDRDENGKFYFQIYPITPVESGFEFKEWLTDIFTKLNALPIVNVRELRTKTDARNAMNEGEISRSEGMRLMRELPSSVSGASGGASGGAVEATSDCNVPPEHLDCTNDKDYISQECWSNNFQPSFKIKYVNLRTEVSNTTCFKSNTFKQYISQRTNDYRGW